MIVTAQAGMALSVKAPASRGLIMRDCQSGDTGEKIAAPPLAENNQLLPDPTLRLHLWYVAGGSSAPAARDACPGAVRRLSAGWCCRAQCHETRGSGSPGADLGEPSRALQSNPHTQRCSCRQGCVTCCHLPQVAMHTASPRHSPGSHR